MQQQKSHSPLEQQDTPPVRPGKYNWSYSSMDVAQISKVHVGPEWSRRTQVLMLSFNQPETLVVEEFNQRTRVMDPSGGNWEQHQEEGAELEEMWPQVETPEVPVQKNTVLETVEV